MILDCSRKYVKTDTGEASGRVAMKTQGRDIIVDIFKLLFSLSIVICHLKSSDIFELCTNVLERAYWFYYNVINRCIVPCFFIISGYYLGKKIYSRPSDAQRTLIKYRKRILVLYIVWTIIYFPYIMKTQSIFEFVQRFLFYGSVNHFWYLSSLIWAVTIILICKNIFAQKSLLLISSALYLVGFWMSFHVSNKWVEFYTKYFLTTSNGLFFGLLFVLLGMRVSQGHRSSRFKTIHKFSALFISLLLLGLECLIFERGGRPASNFYLMLIPSAWLMVEVILDLNCKYKGMVTINMDYFGVFSTIIYCSHLWGAYMLQVFWTIESLLFRACFTISITAVWCFLVWVCYQRGIKAVKYLV